MLKHQYSDDVTSVRGVEPTKPAWTVRYEDHKPPGHNWFHPHVIRIHRYVHEKTARNCFEAEIRRYMHPDYDIVITLSDPSGNDIDIFMKPPVRPWSGPCPASWQPGRQS